MSSIHVVPKYFVVCGAVFPPAALRCSFQYQKNNPLNCSIYCMNAVYEWLLEPDLIPVTPWDWFSGLCRAFFSKQWQELWWMIRSKWPENPNKGCTMHPGHPAALSSTIKMCEYWYTQRLFSKKNHVYINNLPFTYKLEIKTLIIDQIQNRAYDWTLRNSPILADTAENSEPVLLSHQTQGSINHFLT